MLTSIDKLERLANNIEKAGGDDKALTRLGEIEDLEKEAENARRGRDNANRDRVEAENRLSRVRTQINQAVATRDRQNAENTTISTRNTKAESDLATVMEQVNAKSVPDRICELRSVTLLRHLKDSPRPTNGTGGMVANDSLERE